MSPCPPHQPRTTGDLEVGACGALRQRELLASSLGDAELGHDRDGARGLEDSSLLLSSSLELL